MTYQNIRIELLKVTQGTLASDNSNLIEVLRNLDKFTKDKTLPAKLRHFLEKRSYLKALDYIEENCLNNG